MANEINPYINTNGRLKKRVLFIITQSEMGGAQRFLINLVSHLDRDQYEPMVAVGSDPHFAQGFHRHQGFGGHVGGVSGDGSLFRALHNIGIPTHRLEYLKRDPGLGTDMKAVGETRKLIKEFRPDTVFLNSSKAGFIGSLAARLIINYQLPFANWKTGNGKWKMRPKVVYRIGGWSFNDPGPRWQKWLWTVLEWLSAHWKDVIIVNNQRDFDQAIKLKIKPRKKLKLVYNGIETYKLEPTGRDEARDKFKLPTAVQVVGTIANFYPAKGLEYFTRSAYYFQDRNNVVFVIIGDGRQRSELEELIKELGLEDKVLLAGQVPDASKYLSAFDVFVLPSVKEGFPHSLIEAMAAKLPIVATRVGAVPEIIEDGKNGFIVKPGDPQAIADKVKEILANDRLRKEFGIQAHQTVLFKFELDKMVKQIEELL